jgi:hypothetical protein
VTRTPFRCLAVFAVLALAAGAAAAQSHPISIESVKTGFPHGPNPSQRDDQGGAYVCKSNFWTPVYLELKIHRPVDRPAAIVLESNDPDDLGTSVTVPLQNLSDVRPGTVLSAAELAYVPCVRLGGREYTVSIRDPNTGRNLAEPKRQSFVRSRDSSSYIVLSLGSRLPGFELPADANRQKVELAIIDNPYLLPDRWYAYDAADLVVLATGAASVQNFLTPLFTDPQHKPRLDALLEWVRRGGRLVVSVGQNAAIAASFPVLQELLPMRLPAENLTESVKDLAMEWHTHGVSERKAKLGPLADKNGGSFPLVRFEPHPIRENAPLAYRGARQIVPPADSLREGARRAVVQAPYGLGRVTLVAFDLDRSPFLDYEDRAKTWDLILRECGAARAAQQFGKNPGYYAGNTEDELANELRQHADSFASVPVISFGWVAAFIILYTLLIGPVEYYVLKKVFKRLELTWITFPIIVLTVSAIAYFSAYALKGSDMKVNKVDVVDVDPATNRVYGRTWFTVFSPRIDTYRVGVEPAPGWAAPGGAHGGALLDWTGAGTGRRAGLFRRSYQYGLAQPGDPATARFADGLLDVPIQVWSTKGFTADWSAVLDRQSPPVVSTLVHPPANPANVVGTFTLHLPFPELQDVYLLYAGKAYKWDAIPTGVPVNAFLDETKVDSDWITKLAALSVFTNVNQPNFGRTPAKVVSSGVAPLFPILFHEELQRGQDTAAPRNSSLRRLDQSWRISSLHRDEVIVVGRVPTVRDGNAEQVLTAPDSPSPTRVWLKELPGGAKTRTPQQGTLQQETFVRIYLPVKPFKK